MSLSTLSPSPTSQLVKALTKCLNEAETATSDGKPVVVIFDQARNFYAQFCGGDEEGDIHGELVGPGLLAPQDQFSSAQLDLLMSYGWTLGDDLDDLPNHYKAWETEFVGLEQIAEEVQRLACHIFNNDGSRATIFIIK